MISKTYKNLILPFFAIILFSAGFLFYYFNQTPATLAQTPVQAETGANDGIAVRVMPNADHISPLAWYKTNIKQQGSPSRLLVDGYEAVQEGRTVYVNVGNVSGTADLFTNIYIISYTQNAGADTQNIFKQLLNNWTFNTNIISAPGAVGNCVQIKDNTADPADKKCYTDLQCGKNSGLYCDSLKAKVTRDVRRLSDWQEIKIALESYKKKNGKYPELAAGSYLAGKTISVWPSWQKTLGAALGITLLADPINKLVGCDDPNKDGTCWDDKNKKFDGEIPNNLKAGSHVYAYTNDGKACAVMETNYAEVEPFRCK